MQSKQHKKQESKKIIFFDNIVGVLRGCKVKPTVQCEKKKTFNQYFALLFISS